MRRPVSTVKALSLDLRERVITAINEGATCHQAAAGYGASVSSAIRWVDAWRLTGQCGPQADGR